MNKKSRRTVGVVNPHRRSPAVALKNVASFYRTIRKGWLRDGQFPPVLTDAHGTIHKPPGW